MGFFQQETMCFHWWEKTFRPLERIYFLLFVRIVCFAVIFHKLFVGIKFGKDNYDIIINYNSYVLSFKFFGEIWLLIGK